MKEKIDLLNSYMLYLRYWISRRFVDLFGYNYLFNNFMILNRIFKYDDLGDLKKIVSNVSFEYDKDQKLIEVFDKKMQENSSLSEHINYHLEIAIDGYRERFNHFRRCDAALEAFNFVTKTNFVDNIYNLKGEIEYNLFENKFIRESEINPIPYREFCNSIIEYHGDTYEYEKVDIDFESPHTKCSF